MLWLYLHFSELHLNTVAKTQGNRDCIAIVNSKNNCLIQVNNEAKTFGVTCHMGLGAAASLCPNLQLFEYNSHLENKALETIAQHLYHVSADIALTPPNGLLLKVSSMMKLHQSVSHYWQLIEHYLAGLGYSYFFATAYNPVIAQLLAIAGTNRICEDQSDISALLNALPIHVLDLPAATVSTMRKLGIKHILDIKVLSVADLTVRFPKETVKYLCQLRGQSPQPCSSLNYHKLYIPNEFFYEELTLLYEISMLSSLHLPILKLLNLLELFLDKRNLLATEITFLMNTREGRKTSFVVKSAEPLYTASDWHRLALLKLSQITLTAPVILLSIRVDNFEEQSGVTNDLYAGKKNGIPVKQLTSILFNRLGEQHVARLSLGNDHRPEYSSNYQYLDTPNLPDNVSHEDNAAIPWHRPSFLLATPEPLVSDVSLVHGPERIQTAWWESRAVIRDYFIGVNRQGQWCWVYKQPDHQWFIHGYFS